MTSNIIPTFVATIAGDVRIAYVRGELLFVAQDVFAKLGRAYSDPSRDLARACPDEVRQERGLFAGRGHAPLLVTVDGLMRYAARYTPDRFSMVNYLVLEAMILVSHKVADFEVPTRRRKSRDADLLASLRMSSARFRAWLWETYQPAPKPLTLEDRMAKALREVNLGNLSYDITREVA